MVTFKLRLPVFDSVAATVVFMLAMAIPYTFASSSASAQTYRPHQVNGWPQNQLHQNYRQYPRVRSSGQVRPVGYNDRTFENQQQRSFPARRFSDYATSAAYQEDAVVAPVPPQDYATAPLSTPATPSNQNAPTRTRPPSPFPQNALEVNIKDITTIEGHRPYVIHGIGLVAGLKGTGGNDSLTQQLARNQLVNAGIQPRDLPTKNLCAVFVQAKVEPFSAAGEKLTANVSIYGDGNSLRGGTLIRTSLEGVDGRVYALAEGPLQIGGFSAEGAAGAVDKNHSTAGTTDAILEEKIDCVDPFPENYFRLLLRNKNFTTAYRIATKINEYFPNTAHAESPASVIVQIPKPFWQNKTAHVVMVKNLTVRPDVLARVVINEKTGTIVMGQNVKISGVVFAKDNLIITTNEAPVASQPAPFGDGDTVVLPRTQLQAVEQGGRYNMLNSNTTVGELAAALNLLGVTPQDLISVFQAIKQSGALHAELVTE